MIANNIMDYSLLLGVHDLTDQDLKVDPEKVPYFSL
jgi:hypothetical protein